MDGNLLKKEFTMKIDLLFLVSVLLPVLSCAPLKENTGAVEVDLTPPVLLRAGAESQKTLAVCFNEEAAVDKNTVEISPALTMESIRAEGDKIFINLAEEMEAGREYTCKMSVTDQGGNSAWLIIRFYGFNPRIPRILINEFITQGSAAHPDLVEIKVLSPGNMGGLTFYAGTRSRYIYQFVFPGFEVAENDFILLHLKPENIAAEINESDRKDLSGGLDASATAFDWWVKDGTGLSGNNGIITLYAQPDGEILDGVFYSNRTSASDTDYRGFGSRELMEQADELVGEQGWKPAAMNIAPEDGVNPDSSTATRSICRSSTSTDTDTKTDFHIVPTRKASFGKDNTDEIYIP
jgi:hypothetical protein